MSSNEPKRESLLLPILMPVGLLALIAVLAITMGTLLLAMSAEAAALTALGVMVGVVTVAGLVARAKKVGDGGLAVLAVTFFGVALLVGGVSLATFGQPKEEVEAEPSKPAVKLSEIAQGLVFQQADLSAPADTPIELSFDNQDAGTPHNIQVYSGDTADGSPLFSGEIITGVSSAVYKIPELSEGTHLFDCKLHPSMIGKITVGPAEASGGEGGGGTGTSVDQVAKNFAFENAELEVAADAPITINFDNQDSATPHNIRIYSGPDMNASVHFDGEVITGPATTTYSVEPLAAGEYHFDCKIHTNMTGNLVVKAAGADKPAKPEKTTQPESPSGGGANEAPVEPAAPETAAPLNVVAKGVAFETTELSVVADQPFTIEFDNQDASIPHNIEIFGGDANTDPVLFDGEVVTGPVKATYDIDPLPAGAYLYQCKIHANMQGTITAA